MFKNGAVIIGGDFQGLGIARDLAHLKIPIIVVDPDFCISKFSRLIQKCYKCPPLTDAQAFVNFLGELAVKKKLEKWVLMPTSDRGVEVVSKSKSYLEKYYLTPTPAWEITKFAYDKKLTHQLAQKLGLLTPKTFYPESLEELDKLSLDFPVIVKPALKENYFPITKRKAVQANNKDELVQAYKDMGSVIDRSEIIVQELITGGADNLYSFCSVFSGGEVKAKIMAKRPRQHPMDFGNASTYAVTCEFPELEEYAVRLLKGMNYYGLSEIEFMYDSNVNKYKLLEMNARTWGWHALGAAAGVNFSSLLFRDINNEPVFVDSYEKNVKWFRLLTDIPIVISEIWKRRLTFRDYFKSLKGKKVFAVYSNRDPLPFIMEVLLAPYFWYKRGF